MSVGPAYDADIVAWSRHQAALLRAGRFEQLDIERVAQTIEAVGECECCELAAGLASLLVELIVWQRYPGGRSAGRRAGLQLRRRRIERRLNRVPSLRSCLIDADFWADAWDDARQTAAERLQCEAAALARQCPWSAEQVLDSRFLPEPFEV